MIRTFKKELEIVLNLKYINSVSMTSRARVTNKELSLCKKLINNRKLKDNYSLSSYHIMIMILRDSPYNRDFYRMWI